MNDADIHEAVRGLLNAPVPPVPRLESRAPRTRHGAPWMPIVAAAAMVVLLIGLIRPRRIDTPPPSVPTVATQLSAVEARIARIEDPELRALFERELALLRRELAAADPRDAGGAPR